MKYKIVISIINYRTETLTLQCVKSALDSLSGYEGHVVVVDNASEDGSADAIAAWIDEQPSEIPVTLVRSATNTGFSGGHNQGIQACAADYYLLLNSDAILRPDFCSTILKAAEGEDESGLFAPRIEHADGEVHASCFRFPSPASELIRSACTGFVTNALKRYEVSLGPTPDKAAIEWASFACIMLRGQMVREIGPMDEGYFLYFEDAEYCLRARRAGWSIAYVPEAAAVHFRGGSGPVKALIHAKKRLPAYYYSSRSRFLYQAHGWPGLWGANLAWYLGRVIAQLRRLAGRQPYPMAENQQWDIWTNAMRPLGRSHGPESQT